MWGREGLWGGGEAMMGGNDGSEVRPQEVEVRGRRPGRCLHNPCYSHGLEAEREGT